MNATLKQWGDNVGVRISKEILENSDLRLNDDLEIFIFNGGITLQKKSKKTFSDIAKPLMSTKNWKFDRNEAND